MPIPFRLNSQNVYHASILSGIPWLEHGFGTGLSTDWPGARSVATVRQVHSDLILATEVPGLAGEGDALVSDKPGLLVAIRTADCLPILMADLRLHVVAAVHAGWRGTVSGIAPKTIEFMQKRYGTRTEDLAIATGPGIGQCCFEVGPEVARLFGTIFPERNDLDVKTRIDLVRANVRQLRQVGITQGQIVTAGLCTQCGGHLFHSYRRDREASGRMVSAIGVVGV